MRRKRNLIIVWTVFACFVVVWWFSTSLQGEERTYEVRPAITLSQYKTDTARMIDAYERMMDRFFSLSEKNMTWINTDLKSTVKKLDSIDGKLTEFSTRMARIEKALGIEQPKKPTVAPKAETGRHVVSLVQKALNNISESAKMEMGSG